LTVTDGIITGIEESGASRSDGRHDYPTHYTLGEMTTSVEEAKMIEGSLMCAHCESAG
jgi:hypothetical protein